LQCLARSGAFAWLANGRLMVGLDEPREGARGFYDMVARRPSFHTHAVDWYLRVLPLLNIPVHHDFQWLPERPEVAANVHKKWPALAEFPWLVVQPGARWVNKRWPAEAFAGLVRRTAEAYPDVRLAILGAAEDRPLGALIQQASPKRCLDLTGELSLAEMVEWIRSSKLMVTNDTGPMHVAAALGRPIVAVFGPTEPRRTGPYGQIENVLQSADLPCVPCLKSRCRYLKPFECLRSLDPDTVFESVDRRLRELGNGSNHSTAGAIVRAVG
jgi:lipopolysaccharide heptosyltransferase II